MTNTFHKKHISNPIPKDIPFDKTLFQINECRFDHFISGISFIFYIDPQALIQSKDPDIKNKVYQVMDEALKKVNDQNIIVIAPRLLKLRMLKHRDYPNFIVWVELMSDEQLFNLDPFHIRKKIDRNDSKHRISFKKVDPSVINQKLLAKPNNHIVNLLQDADSISQVIKLINVTDLYCDDLLNLSLNSTLNQAICYFTNQASSTFKFEDPSPQKVSELLCSADPNWRKFMAFEIARQMNFDQFGVKAVYLIGSVKNNRAAMGSDIDLMIHFAGSNRQKEDLALWMEGWSRSLSLMNYLKTGYRTDGILDIHYVSDQSIERKDSFAIKINAITDPALVLKKA